MSGFLAVINPVLAAVDAQLVEHLAQRLRFLGPDGLYIHVDGPVGMAVSLYRTTDEARRERQPASLDGITWAVARARIDDRATLASRLGSGQEGRFEETPSVEWILRAYERWGVSCPEHLLGDYAFAVWDGREARLVCARDHFGMCQLYYAQVGKTFIVSNSLYCLLGHPEISLQLDEKAIGAFLLFGDHTWSDRSITAFVDIKAVPPAHRLVVQDCRAAVDRYWDFPVDVPMLQYRRNQEVVEGFREVLGASIADRARTDAVVVALSGGMDSSSMAAMARKRIDGSRRAPRLHAVTVAYDHVHPSNERALAKQVADHLDIPIDFIRGDDYPLLQPPVPTTRPLELYNPLLWVEYLRTASRHARVLFEGEGGDSVFAYSAGIATLRGSKPLRAAVSLIALRRRYGHWPALGTGMLAALRRTSGRKSAHAGPPFPFPEWLDADFERRLGLRELWNEHWKQTLSPLNQRHPKMHEALAVPDWARDATYLHPDFTPPDVRDPFLDLRVVGFLLALPPMPWLYRKHLLRRAMAEYLPEAVLTRAKTPLGRIHESLAAQPEARWIDSWFPDADLYPFVDRSRIPSLKKTNDHSIDRLYVDFRPLLLEQWIRSIKNALRD